MVVEEVNAVDVVHEIVEITVDKGAAKSVWPILKNSVTRTKATTNTVWKEMCDMKFLDADVKRPLGSVRATVDVFKPQESYIERIPMSRRNGVCVVQLDAQAGSNTTINVRLDEPNTKCGGARKEVCVTRIKEVDDVEHKKSGEHKKQEEEEEFGERKTTRKHDPGQPSKQERKKHEMTHLPFRSWCRHRIRGGCERRTVAKQLKKRGTACSLATQRKGKRKFFGGQRKSDESCAQHGGSVPVGGRVESGHVEG